MTLILSEKKRIAKEFRERLEYIEERREQEKAALYFILGIIQELQEKLERGILLSEFKERLIKELHGTDINVRPVFNLVSNGRTQTALVQLIRRGCLSYDGEIKNDQDRSTVSYLVNSDLTPMFITQHGKTILTGDEAKSLLVECISLASS